MYGIWRRPMKRMYVTNETEIPKAPEKLLKYPDDTSYHKQQVELDEQYDKLNEKLQELS